MTPAELRIHKWSRDKAIITKTALGILLAAFLASLVIDRIRPVFPRGREYPLIDQYRLLLATGQFPAAEELLRRNAFEGEPNPGVIGVYLRVTAGILQASPGEGDPDSLPIDVHEMIGSARLGPGWQEILGAYWDCLTMRPGACEPQWALIRAAAEQDAPPLLLNEFAGEIMIRREEAREALRYFRREAAGEAATLHSRHRVIELALATENRDLVRSLLRDDAFRPVFDRIQVKEAFRLLGRYDLMIWAVLKVQIAHATPLMVLLALFSASTWFIIMIQCGQTREIQSIRFAIHVTGFVLGALSPTVVLVASAWQEDVWGLHEAAEMTALASYYFAGVGLREEAIKLLFFVPLLPVILKRNHEVEALIAASLVGLGFAAVENINYFESAGAEAGQRAFWRFLSANFFHMATTGILGLALCKAIALPKKYLDNFLITFASVVLVHGCYDLFIVIPAYFPGHDGMDQLSSVVLILLAYYFFNQLRKARDPDFRHLVAPVATFVVYGALLLGVVYCFTVWAAGLKAGLQGLGYTVALYGILGYLFVREFHEL